ncbi:hypothetical protein EDD21DRAFT_365512 [Dissophora ornata]|nr:hypothetical protein EDD21DRAFT_365512 [Dissophora ornata]
MQSCHLKQLQVPAPTLTRDPELLRSISSVLPRLRKLKIDGGDISMMQFLQIMDACTHHPQLIDLKCSFTVQDPRFHQEGPQHDDTLSLHRSGIRVFELPLMRRGYPGCLVLQILEHALPELERLSIVGRTIRERQWKKLTRTIQERCPKLKHFCCNFADEVPDPVLREAVAVIRGCAYQGLTSFKCLGHHVDRSTLGSKTNIVRALIDDHSATLEDFEMKDCADVSSADLQDMLATCSNLRRFWVEPGERGEAAAAAAALEYVDVLSRGWVCLELQELYLILDRNLSDDSPLSVPDSNDDLEEAVAAREVYAQIGRLVQLEVLCLGCNASDYATVDEEAFAQDLTLKNGWLSELKGLGQLQHFRMVTNFWSHMGQAEVEFMDTHWPRLRTITFEWLEAGDDITGAAHWRWLRKRRPGLQFEWSSFIPEPRLVRF